MSYLFENIVPSDIPMMADHADAEANPLYPVPVIWGQEEFRQLIESVRK